MLPFLKKHIPGNPTVVIEYMDGGGGRKGANHIFSSARPDGLTIGGVGSPYILPPGTPKERIEILQEAMRKTFIDPEFPKYFRKLVDDDPSPLNAADLARVVREMPREVELQDMLRKISGAAPLPPR